MGKGSAPSAPDPYQSAQAQYQFGTEAANYNMGLNAVNQVTPFGSTTWSVNPGGIQGAQGTPPANPAGPAGLVNTPNAAAVQPSAPAPNGSYNPNSPQAVGVQFGNNPTRFLTPAGGGTMPGTGPGGLSDPYAQGGGNTPPQYTETQTLSPTEEQMLEGSQGLTLGSQGLARQAGQGVGQTLSSYQMPTEAQNGMFGGQAMQSAYGVETASMDPHWDNQQEQLDASLRNSGATPGTPAYDNAMREFNADRASAYGQAENQAFGQGLSAQGQEIQDVNAAEGGEIGNFLSLLQQSPAGAASIGSSGGGGGGAGSVSAPNIMQAFENQYQGELANYNANVSSSNADMGALATLAAAFIASDKRLKTDIEPIHAKTSRGNPLYEYRYKFQPKGSPKQIGVMAQEAEKNTPNAVIKDPQGIRYVDYARA